MSTEKNLNKKRFHTLKEINTYFLRHYCSVLNMKATAVAPSNIAFIKYWGRKDEALRLPENGSISMNLSNLLTTTTVEFNPDFKEDEIIINGVKEKNEGSRAIKHLDRIRKIAQNPSASLRARVVTKNNFPTGT